MNSTNPPTTTTDSLNLIGKQLEAVIKGEPLPSLRDDAFGLLMAALSDITRVVDQPQRRSELARLGLLTAALLMSQLQDSMRAERGAAEALRDAKRTH